MPSFEKTIGGYLVDVGYSIQSPTPDQTVTFNADLYTGTGDSLQFAPFKTVAFTIDQSGSAVTTKLLQNVSPNVPTFMYAFPSAGSYTVNVAYAREDGSTVRASFPMTVLSADAAKSDEKAEAMDDFTHYFFGTFLLIVGGIALIIMIRQRM